MGKFWERNFMLLNSYKFSLHLNELHLKFAGSFDGSRLSAISGSTIHLDGFQLLGDIELYHRDELGDQLGIRYIDLRNYSDGMLVLLAYKKWGQQFFQYLYGAWSIVLHDVDSGRVLISKDPTENSCLFYLRYHEKIYFSNYSNFFQDRPFFDLRIDENEFIQLSLRLVGNSTGKTIINGLYCVCTQSFLMCGAEMNIVGVDFPTKEIPFVRFKHEKDYFMHLRSLLAEAVICRLQSARKPGIFLSSGLDSTTVCSFLHKAIDAGKYIHSYTSVPNSIDAHDDIDRVSEQPLVEHFLKQYSNVKSSFLQFPNIQFAAQFKHFRRLDFIHPIIHSNTFWLRGILEQAKLDGVDRMFTGQMGNYSISFRGEPAAWAFYISRWMRYFFSNLCGGYFFKKQQWRYSVIHDDLIRRITKSKSFKAEFKLGYDHSLHISTFRKNAFKKIHEYASVQWSLLAQEFGIRLVDPTSDSRLMNFLDAIPSKLFHRKGIPKYLLKQTMLRMLPTRILFNRIPKPQSADVGKRLAHEHFLSEIVDFLIEKYKNSNFFDVRKLKAVHTELVATVNRQRQHVLSFHLLYMISMIICYDRLQRGKS